MIIENQWQKFYVPDNIWNDKTKNVADIFEAAIPYDEYIKQENLEANIIRIAEIENELIELEKEPNEILVPNDSKFMQVTELENEFNLLTE